jgi:hypothetical protein
LAAASAGVVVDAGRGDGNGAFAAGADADAGGRDADDPGARAGSGVMMLIGGVEAAVGNSALVGLPVGTNGASAATGAAAGGAFQDGA